MGRRLCLISLLVIIIVALSVYGPWDYLGAYSKANAVSESLSDGMHIQATGVITHKEIKNHKVLYYVEDATIICEDGSVINNSFFFRFDSTQIPNKSKINIEGKVGLFMEARNEGGFDMKDYYNSIGYYFELKDVSINSIFINGIVGRDYLFRLSQSILYVYDKAMPADEAGLLASITIGNKSELDNDIRTLFQQVGIAHILAVSGLHVSVICMALYRFLRKRGLSFLQGALASGVIAIFYGCLTGGSISSIRAIGMFLIYILADVLGESYDSLTALSVMGDLLVISNPLVLKNISFIYSFGAILCILLIVLPMSKCYRMLCNQRERLRVYDSGYSDKNKEPLKAIFVKWFKGSLIFSVGIYISMLPIVTNMNYETPIYSAFLNILLLPMLPFLLGFGLVGGFVGLFSISLSKLILFPCHMVITCFKTASTITSRLPFTTAIIGKHSMLRIVIFYLLLIVLVRVLVKRIEVYNSMDTINPRTRVGKCSRTLFLVCIMGICVGLLWFAPVRQGFEIDILDVGQGDGIYISSGDGVRFFIDGGSTSSDTVGKYTMKPFLKYKGATKIDYWFLSHMDLDHVSGLLELLEDGYHVKNIVLSSEIPDGETLEKLLALCEGHGTNVLYMRKGDVIGTKHLSFSCLYPGSNPDTDDVNELSLALLMKYDKDLDGRADFSGFFGGDLGADQEKFIADSGTIGHVNLLKVSHHGSRFSSDETFLRELSPDVAVVSCSKVNRYGHPAIEAVARLEKNCDEIYYTMNSGRVRIDVNGVDEFVKLK